MARNGKVILSKGIKLDKSYKQVLSFSEANMISLMSDNSHLVSYKTNYSFIRERGSIQVQETYANCLKANYMAFQNTDYSGKWFFCFIDKCTYINSNTTEIYYTVDVWTTWFDYWNPKTCYVVRQHATSDGIGENTVPEGIEHGGYIVNGTNYYHESRFEDYVYMVISTNKIPQDQQTGSYRYVSMGGAVVNGYVHALATADEVDEIAKIIDSQQDGNNILFVYMVPSVLIPASAIDDQTSGLLKSWASPYNDSKKVLSRPTSLDGYTPVNKKLLTYPYQFCYFDNLSGASNILKYELSGRSPGLNNLEAGAIYIQYFGVPTIGGSVIAIPQYYENNVLKLNEALVLGKYPTLGWSEDAYINWLTQNSVNNTVNNIKTAGEIALGVGAIAGGIALAGTGVGASLTPSLITTGTGMLASGGVDAINSAIEDRQHQIEPDSYKGNTNAGDILTCIGAMGFDFNGMSIKSSWAQKIDKFFTRFGYKQNAIMQPNLSHRANYNYVQISKDSTTAYSNNHNNICVPASDLELINNIFRAGVTVWNNHTNLGDYSVTNGITS